MIGLGSGTMTKIKNDTVYFSFGFYLRSILFFGLIFLSDLLMINLIYKDNVSFVVKGIIFILLLHLFICFHELGHFVIFVVSKIYIKSVYVFPFYINFDSRSKLLTFKIEISYLGIVIPEVDEMNQGIYSALKRNLYIVYLAGPMINFILLLVFGVLMLIKNNYIYSFSVIINILMIYMAFKKNDTTLGDFVVCKYIKKNEMYFVQIIYNYCMMSSNEFSDNNKSFLIEKLKSNIVMNKRSTVNKRALFYLIQEELKCEKGILNSSIEAFINDFYEMYIGIREDEFNYLLKKSLDIILYERIILYFIKTDEYEKACILYNKIKQKVVNNYIYVECKWLLDNGDNPYNHINKIFNKNKNSNYFKEECKIIDNLMKFKIEYNSGHST